MRQRKKKERTPIKLGDRVLFTKSGHKGEVVDQRKSDGKFAVSTAITDGELSGKVWCAEVNLVRIHGNEPLDVAVYETPKEGDTDPGE